MGRNVGVVAVLLVALAGCGTAPPPSLSPAPPAPSLPILADWQHVEVTHDGRPVRFVTVVATPAGFVAAGGSPERPLAWSSVDGLVWAEEPVPGDMRTPTDAIWWNDRVLMVGSGGFAPGCGHPVAVDTWVRDGPGLWNQAPFQPLFCAGGEPSVAAAGGLAVMVGAGAGDVPYAWSSDDGLHWTDHGGVFAEVGLPHKVLATPAGFVALGTSDKGAWFELSPDAARWRQLVYLPAAQAAQPIGATVRGTRLVVFLGDPAGRVQRLSSEEPSTWTVDEADGLVSSTLIRIESTPGGLVALGGDDGGPALWASADGLAWRRAVLPDALIGGYVADVAVGHGRVVIVGGTTGELGEVSSAVWVGPASLLAP